MTSADSPAKRRFRFGVGLSICASRKEWIDKCRKAEGLGYDVIGVADHVDMPAPFPSLAIAAEVTERPRVSTFVLNAGFYNPALLARDIASTDQLTDGRLEIGIGTGYKKIDFDEIGIPLPEPGRRVDRLQHIVTELRRRFSNPGSEPRPKQRPHPPLWIPGRGDRLLSLAAHEADIVGFTGFAPGNEGGIGYLADINSVAERVEYVKSILGERIAKVELNVFVWRALLTNNRVQEAKRLEPMRTLTSNQMLNVPTVLIGTAKQIADQLIEYRERFGFTYITVEEYNLEPLGKVIEFLA